MDWFEWAMKVIVVVGGVGVAFGLVTASLRMALGRSSRRLWVERMLRHDHDPARGEELAELRQMVERLTGDVGELQERLDFAERMLAQQRERPALPDR